MRVRNLIVLVFVRVKVAEFELADALADGRPLLRRFLGRRGLGLLIVRRVGELEKLVHVMIDDQEILNTESELLKEAIIQLMNHTPGVVSEEVRLKLLAQPNEDER